VYHVASGEALSKHDFGQRIAARFGLDGSLIQPVSWREAGLKAARSPNLTLNVDKLRKTLGSEPPTQDQCLERFYELFCAGYPQKLRALRQ
jgi:dTDP-4-dehydrorhamnose reductase